MISPGVARARAREVILAVRRREFPYVPRPKRKIRWSLYDRAQAHELPDMLDLIARSVDQLDLPPPRTDRRGGRPPVPLSDLLKSLLLQSYRQVANRTAEGDLRAMGVALRVRRRFSYKSLERAYSHPGLLRALEELLELTNRPVRGHETVFAVDGSGFSTSVPEHYRTYRARVSAREGPAPLALEWHHLWVFHSANVGVRYGLIAAWKSRIDHDGREIDAFAEIFERTREKEPENPPTAGGQRILGALGDRSPNGTWGRGSDLPSEGPEAGRSGVAGLGPGLVVDPQRWMSEYHQRSRVESMGSALKCRAPGKMRKRRPERLVAEGWLRAVVYNLRRLCYLAWLERDGLDLLRAAK
jgi:transposase